MGLIISTRQFGSLFGNLFKRGQKEDQYIARVFKDVKLDSEVTRVSQETLGNLMTVNVEVLIGNDFNLDLVYRVNLDTDTVSLVENTGWVEQAEDTLHNLTPKNWEKEFKKAIWIGKLYQHSEVLTYWNAYTEQPDELAAIKRFFQKDYSIIPEIILNAIKSNN